MNEKAAQEKGLQFTGIYYRSKEETKARMGEEKAKIEEK